MKLHRHLGDYIISKLRIGMSEKEVDSVFTELKPLIIREYAMHIRSENDVFYRYRHDYFPRDLLTNIAIGKHFKSLEYWTHYTGKNIGILELYFDDETKQLRGWVNMNDYSRDKFLHERLTSKLKITHESRGRMTRAQVLELLGQPTRTALPAKQESRELYEDHFWESHSFVPPTAESTNQMDVYEYDMGNGKKRHVYVAYTRANDKLQFFGYDHAWEEAERYAHARAK
ncbi:MAG: hypothetical protein K2P84_11405 [Undibacterium sp.]|nr:hypothetical protein [Undibacterium sp.]